MALSFGSVTDQSLEILYSSNFDVGGFQFAVDGATLTGASSDLGDVSFSDATGIVVGFSFTGGSLAAGSGSLATVNFAPTNDGGSVSVGSVTVTSSGAVTLASSGPGSTLVDGCYETDCADVCYGDGALDDCDVCDGGNADDLGCGCFEAGPSGCDNTCGSTLENDDCGVCDGGNQDLDECGVCFGDSSSCEDACGIPNGDGASCPASLSLGSFDPSGSLEVIYDFGGDVAGFQFDVTGLTLPGASGGAAGDAGFTVQAGGATVIGFSFSGATVAAGGGVLTVLNFSDITADSAELSLGNFGTTTNSEAQDYITTASGSIVHDTDCAGNYYGDTTIDDCGVCGGGNADQDDCGVCDGGYQDQDCAGD